LVTTLPGVRERVVRADGGGLGGYRTLGDDRQVRQILMAQPDDQLARTDTSWADQVWGRLTRVVLGYGYQPGVGMDLEDSGHSRAAASPPIARLARLFQVVHARRERATGFFGGH
jgi:hypothetical protein